MPPAPLVSVIIPCYQAEKYVKEAVDSVFAQTYSHLEIIAIDDGSTDRTLSVLEAYRGSITILQHPDGVNRGVSLTRKLGVDHAKGKYIAFLDADDCFEPGKIQSQVDALEQNSGAVLCHTAISQICEPGTDANFEEIFNCCSEQNIYDLKKSPKYLLSNRICNSSVLIRGDILRKIPYYGKQIFQYEDWLMWTFAAEYGLFIYIPGKYTRYRVHAESATSRVESNKLNAIYSRIEFYMSIMSRSDSVAINNKCAYLLIRNLDRLCREYGSNSDIFLRNKSIRTSLVSSSLKYYLYNSWIVVNFIKPLVKIFSH